MIKYVYFIINIVALSIINYIVGFEITVLLGLAKLLTEEDIKKHGK